MDHEQQEQIARGTGFFAALDQSGGSTPKALKQYGIDEDQYDETRMFDLVHQMRTRMITSPAFAGDKILAAILFEHTMDRTIEGVATAAYLWDRKHVVPILKVDQGLAEEQHGVQLMKPIVDLVPLLERAVENKIFGTKMRSVVNHADEAGIAALMEQQLVYADQVLSHGLVPILEPEVSITSSNRRRSEELLKARILRGLDALPPTSQVMLKISIPEADGFYRDVMEHPRMMRVLALSGGYSRREADERLHRNPGLIASFSRALAEGLSVGQSDREFDATLQQSVDEIYAASLS